MDLEGRILTANPAAEKITGYPSEELLRMSYYDLLSLSRERGACPHFEKAVRGEPVYFESNFRNKNGVSFALGVKLVPIDVNGLIEGVYRIAKDITARERGEQEKKATKEQLESFVRYSTDAIVTFDKEGTVREVNPAFERLFFRENDPRSILQDVISLLETQAILSNVKLFMFYETDISTITCDENQMKISVGTFEQDGQ